MSIKIYLRPVFEKNKYYKIDTNLIKNSQIFTDYLEIYTSLDINKPDVYIPVPFTSRSIQKWIQYYKNKDSSTELKDFQVEDLKLADYLDDAAYMKHCLNVLCLDMYNKREWNTTWAFYVSTGCLWLVFWHYFEPYYFDTISLWYRHVLSTITSGIDKITKNLKNPYIQRLENLTNHFKNCTSKNHLDIITAFMNSRRLNREPYVKILDKYISYCHLMGTLRLNIGYKKSLKYITPYNILLDTSSIYPQLFFESSKTQYHEVCEEKLIILMESMFHISKYGIWKEFCQQLYGIVFISEYGMNIETLGYKDNYWTITNPFEKAFVQLKQDVNVYIW